MRNVGSNVANVGNAAPDNGLNVNDWNRDNGNRNVGAVRLVVSRKKGSNLVSFAWWHESSHQASCLFLAALIEALGSFCPLNIDYLWRVLRGF